MMSVKRVMLLLLLAAIGTIAASGPEDCEGLNKTLPTKDLHKTFGDWVLVWAVSDHPYGSEVLATVSSSRIEVSLLSDNETIMYNEFNRHSNKSCTNYYIKASMPSGPSDHHTLTFNSFFAEKSGAVILLNDSVEVDFFETCADCLMMIFKMPERQFLLSYRREGHHKDAEQLKSAHSHYEKLAECLAFPHDKPFIYDGAADFCAKSSPVVTPEQS